MGPLSPLIRLTGKWKGTNRLWMSPSDPPRDSPSVASVTPIVREKFVRIDYTWSFENEPQEGILLLGREGEEDLATAIWIDSWHMGDKFMICRGAVRKDGGVTVRGSYAVPPGPDWGWRTDIEIQDEDSFRLTMHNVLPDGREALAVETVYARVR